MQQDAGPPAKRRKTATATPPAEPGKRRSEVLDLRFPLSDLSRLHAQKRQVDALLKLLRKKKKIVVVAGAGISVGAGIPDFRSSNGLFCTLRTDLKLKTSGKELFDASVYKDNQLTSSFHDMVRSLHQLTAQAAPTEFHHLLATLAHEKRLLRLYSQNVDCIDTQLEPLNTSVPLGTKGPWPRTIQLHGGLEKMVCSKCGTLSPFKPTLFEGPEPPDCAECMELESVRGVAGKRSLGVGKLRPRIVLYNEFNPDADAIGAVTSADLKARPDALLVVGTSLKVPGVRRIVREMCGVVQDYRGGMTVWINESDPPSGKEFEGAFDLVVRGDCEKVARLADFPRWDGSERPPPMDTSSDSDSCGSFIEVHPDAPARTGVHVQVEIPVLPRPPSAGPNGKKQPARSKAAKAPAKAKKAKPTTTKVKQKDGTLAKGWRVTKTAPAKVARPKVATQKAMPQKTAPMPAPAPILPLLNSAASTRTPSPSSSFISPPSSSPLSSLASSPMSSPIMRIESILN